MPLSKQHQGLVEVNRDAGSGYFHLVLRAPSLAAQARPGHFVMLRVSGGMDPLLARPFGIASVRARRSVELYYRVAGRGTSLLTEVKAGRALAVSGPFGNGFPPPARGETPLLVAGGSGFPPLLFFAARHGRGSHLFTGSRDKSCQPPSAVLKAFSAKVRKIHYATEDGSCGICGFVTDALAAYLEETSPASRMVIYACGPRPMLSVVAHVAATHSVQCYVSMEERMACGLGVCMGCAIPLTAGGYSRACTEGPVFDSRDVDWIERVAAPVNNVNVKRET